MNEIERERAYERAGGRKRACVFVGVCVCVCERVKEGDARPKRDPKIITITTIITIKRRKNPKMKEKKTKQKNIQIRSSSTKNHLKR